jgi:hypothetical protein
MLAKSPRRRGPPGSVGLTAEMEDKVLTLMRGCVAAFGRRRSGDPVRTLQGWVARGAGHLCDPTGGSPGRGPGASRGG